MLSVDIMHESWYFESDSSSVVKITSIMDLGHEDFPGVGKDLVYSTDRQIVNGLYS